MEKSWSMVAEQIRSFPEVRGSIVKKMATKIEAYKW
jgi:predicted secreted Zn-dependent protease